jgi:cytochrome c oxidase accessory protein FixG
MSGNDPAVAEPEFFVARRSIFPKAVDGPFRRFKWLVMAVALTIYYVTPWLRWNRGPYAPDQAVLIDLAHRRFYMFQIEIWPHEFYYVAGLLIMAGIGLFLVTSAVGRAWCGYACPQTVWTDLFVHVERAIDGDRNAQIRLQAAPWSPAKLARRAAKHGIWLFIAALTGGAWIFYFADAPTLARSLFTGTAPSVAVVTIAVLTFTTYVLGGLMREQVCIYMCPWPRIQSAMLDEQSLMVTYKAWRGEPRSHGLKRQAAEPVKTVEFADFTPPAIGDCIDCNACVAVCPTGIDIREGPQIGCITCGLCVDACDQVMARIGRPDKLIGYTSVADTAIAVAGGTPLRPLRRLLRPRTIAYFAVWIGIGGAMLFSLGTRTRLDLNVQPDRNPQWVRLSDGNIRNAYTVKLRNMESRPRDVEVAISGVPAAVLWSEAGDRKSATQHLRVLLGADQVVETRLFVAAPAAVAEHTPLAFSVRALDAERGGDTAMTSFDRPEGARTDAGDMSKDDN